MVVAQGLREPRQSVDADVLVDSRGVQALLGALAEAGWHERVEHVVEHELSLHSWALVHDGWPCELDVHRRFPGLLARAEVAFDALWERRAMVEVAGVAVPATDPVGSAAILALHALRDPGVTHKEAEFEALCDRLSAAWGSAERAALRDLAEATGSAESLGPLLTRLGEQLPSSRLADPEAVEVWRVRTAAVGTAAVPWVYELAQAPWRRRPALLWHAIFLSEAEIRDADPAAASGWRGLSGAWWRRLGRGLKDLPAAIRIVRKSGR